MFILRQNLIRLQISAICLVLISFSVLSQNSYILHPSHTFEDRGKKLIISNLLPEFNQTSGDVYFQYQETSFKLQTISSELKYGIPYQLVSDHETFTLYFSELPLINAQSYQTIVTYSDDLVPGKFEISDTEGFYYSSFIGIKVRGATSRSYPKKSYQIRLWTDSASYETKDESFFQMRNDDKWLLLAMWNEQNRLNNVFCHDLWLRMHKLYYADSELKANSAIRLKYVEFFLDGNYQGVYAFSENMDRKQLKLKKTKEGNIRGELYKGISWGQGLHRYLTDEQSAQILKDIVKIKIGKADESLAKEFFSHFCRINGMNENMINEPNGGLLKK